MSTHTCFRCGYDTNKFGNMKKHLVRKKLCDPIEEDDIPAFEEFKQIYFIEKTILLKCERCHKGFISKRGHKIHMTNCNVEYVPEIKNTLSKIIIFDDIESLNNHIDEKINSKIQEIIPLLNKNVKTLSGNQLVPVEGIQDIGVPSGVRPPNCVYCILIGSDPTMQKYVFKFGLTDNFHRRMTEHQKTYPQSIVIFVVSLGEYAVKPAEDTIKYFEKIKNNIIHVDIKKSIGHEHFACLKDDMDLVMEGLIDEIRIQHGNKIDNIYYKTTIGVVIFRLALR